MRLAAEERHSFKAIPDAVKASTGMIDSRKLLTPSTYPGIWGIFVTLSRIAISLSPRDALKAPDERAIYHTLAVQRPLTFIVEPRQSESGP